MQQDAQTKAELSKYDDQLARARAADEHEKYRQRNAELVRMQEEASARQEQQKRVVAQQIEAERRATEQHKVSVFLSFELNHVSFIPGMMCCWRTEKLKKCLHVDG